MKNNRQMSYQLNSSTPPKPSFLSLPLAIYCSFISSYHSFYSKITYFATAPQYSLSIYNMLSVLKLLNIRKLLRAHMIILYVCQKSTYTQKEIKRTYCLLTLQPSLNLLQFKGLLGIQKLCFSAPCARTALHEILGWVQRLNPKISPYVIMTAAISYKIS